MVQELLTKSGTCQVEHEHQIHLLGATVHVETNDHIGEGGNVWTAVEELASLLERSALDLKAKRVL